MCGIAGIVDQRPIGEEIVRQVAAMSARLQHRGPDGDGLWSDGNAALAHRRLSIIDTSAHGAQPMHDARAGHHLVCNGEIYNFRALRDAYPDYPYGSSTDVETILPAYAEKGADCVAGLVGMFAFAVWDAPRRRLLLARDRFGEKPLYYAVSGTRLAFASEIKALLALPWVDRAPDREAFPFLFASQSLPAPYTAHAGIRQLGPAQTLVWEDGRVRVDNYWSLDYSRRRALSAAVARERYAALMREIVGGEMVADVPVGVMLSGGVDSSTVARYAAEGGREVHTYCVGFDRPGRPDIEFGRATRVAEILGTRHRNVNLPDLGLEHAIQVLAHYDQPMSSMVALYADHLAAEIRSDVKVVLSGNGADEVLAGYAGYAHLPYAGWLAPLARLLPQALVPARLASASAAAGLPAPEARGLQIDRAARALGARLVTPEYLRVLDAATPSAPAVAAARRANAETLLDATLVSDLMVSHQHGHAVIADMSGMAHGLELRAPFLDHRLAEFAAELPVSALLGCPPRKSATKRIAKECLSEILPREIVYARKVGFGFNVDIAGLFKQAWRPRIERLLTSGAYLDLGIFSREGARWALDHSFFATAILFSTAVWAEGALAARSPAEIAHRYSG